MRRFPCCAMVAAIALMVAAPARAEIWTVAGSGAAADAGDGGPATAAALVRPYGVDVAADGSVLIADWDARRVRRVAPGATIETVAGALGPGSGGDGGPATAARLEGPVDVAALPAGGFLICEWDGQRIRRVGSDGAISTVAGNGFGGFDGDGGPATQARLNHPMSVAVQDDGGFLIADWLNQRVRRVAPDGTITTVAGTGVAGFSGDGGPAAGAELHDPMGVAALPGGAFLIADHSNARIRRVAADGVITTVAGTGVAGFGGDGGAANAARLDRPVGVDAAPDGSFLIADRFNQRVRRVAADGTITTVAGIGVAGFGGDGGPATAALLNQPSDVAMLAGGAFVIADGDNHRVRLVTPDAVPPPFTAPVDPTLIVEVEDATPVSAAGGRTVWSAFDSRSRAFVLMTRAGRTVARVPVAPRPVPFDVDLGIGRGGHVVAAYSRCRSQPPRDAARIPDYTRARGCRVYVYDFTTRRQTRAGSGFLPSVSGSRIAFARRRGGVSDLYIRGASGRSRRVERSVRRLTRLDLAGRTLAYAAGGAVRIAGGRRASPARGRFGSPVLSHGWVYFSGPHALWRYRLTSGRREVSPLASTPAAFALGSRPVVLTGRSGAWRLRLAEARFTARPAYAEPR